MSLIDYNGLKTTLNGLGIKLNDIEQHRYDNRPDYNQNNETSDDYIKNRPFYDTRATEKIEITFDGTLDGKEYIEEPMLIYVKISDKVLTGDELIGATVSDSNGNTITISEDNIDEDDVVCSVASDSFPLFIVVKITLDEAVTTGIWAFICVDADTGEYLSYPTSLIYSVPTGELKQLDEKYYKQPQQSDWCENDDLSLAYIKNKPFYDYVGQNVVIYESDNAPTSVQSSVRLVSPDDMGDGLLVEGETYTLTINGVATEHTCELVSDGSLCIFYDENVSNYIVQHDTGDLRAWTTWDAGASVKLEGPLRHHKKLDSNFYDTPKVNSVNGSQGDVKITASGLNAASYLTNNGTTRVNAKEGIYFYKNSARTLTYSGDGVFEFSTGYSIEGVTLYNNRIKNIHVVNDEYDVANKKYVDSYAIPIPSSADIGQIIKVSAVDDNGVPTAWEVADVPVQSVNGQTGEITLTASDVGALPDTTEIPSIEGLASESYVDNAVAGVNAVPSATTDDNDKILMVVNGVPTWIAITNAEGVAY